MPNVLIVEDNPINTQTVQRLLGREGYTVVIAGNGREAMSKLELVRFDLVVTDLAMPFVSGTDLVRHIKATTPLLPVIVVSSMNDEKTRAECYALGADHFFLKPVNPTELVVKIRNLVEA